ncbi:MAG: O-antigen ligase family protein [Thiothrix sp.]|nr:O-antigen ligase family protein [Thiothrix sp.]
MYGSSLQKVLSAVAMLMLLLAMGFGGKTTYPVLIQQLLGLGVLLLIFGSGAQRRYTHPSASLFWLLVVLLAGLYLVPLPEPFWHALPGRELFRLVEPLVQPELGADAHLSHTLSLSPEWTRAAWLQLIPVCALFFLGSSLHMQRAMQVVGFMLVLGALESLLGLIQYAAGEGSPWLLGAPFSGGAQGTWNSRNHFVAMVELSLPMAITLTLYLLTRSHLSHHHSRQDRTGRLVLMVGVITALFLGGVFSRSRAGIVLLMIGMLLVTLISVRQVRKRHSLGLMAVLATLCTGLAATIGLVPVLNRFVTPNPVAPERWRIYEQTGLAIRDFLPLGSGPGTFAGIYRLYQPADQPGLINHAHNDYLELLLETGLIGLIMVSLFLLLYGHAWVRLHRQRVHHGFRFVQLGAGVGIFLFLLHGLLDFNFHVLANTCLFAFVCGLFFRIPEVSHPRQSRAETATLLRYPH